MSVLYFSKHATARARERYGLELTAADMLEILRACNDGRASMMQTTDAGEVFVWRYKGKVILPVLREQRAFIITFQPPDFFTAGTRKERSILKTTTGTAHGLKGREYHRARSTREAMRDEEDGWITRRNMARAT